MADVFISYKRENRRAAEALHAYLTSRGFSTWWDTRLIAGENFNSVIARELRKSSCVIVLWTRTSYASQWVQAEALYAFNERKLINARLDPVELDVPFSAVQAADLLGWSTSHDDERLQAILDGVEGKVGRKAQTPKEAAPQPEAIAVEPDRSSARDLALLSTLREAANAFASGMSKLGERKGASPTAPRRRIMLIVGGAALGLVLLVGGVGFAAVQGLPSLGNLENYVPPVTSQFMSGEGGLVAESARETRRYVPLDRIPQTLQDAFDSVHDASSYARTIVDDTLLGHQPSLFRAIRSLVLSQRLSSAMSAARLREVYFNEIYFGDNAYGVGAAALNYFDKPLDELTVGECAFLAAVSEDPARYDPRTREGLDAAATRRNAILAAMRNAGRITAAVAQTASAEAVVTHDRLAGDQYVAAAPFVSNVSAQVSDLYGEQALHDGGLTVRTTIDTGLQLAAVHALKDGLEAYDRRREWRGPVGSGDARGDIAGQLRSATVPPVLSDWVRAMVTNTSGGITVKDETGASGRLLDADAQWAAQSSRAQRQRALAVGSIVFAGREQTGRYSLKQIPALQGALVAMDPHTGRVLALVEGYSPSDPAHRATALHTPGSAFMPILTAAALNSGLTPATLVDDGPLSINARDDSQWSPENYDHDWLGPTTLRRGLELSRNAMTARVAYQLGPQLVFNYGVRLGVLDQHTIPVFALALGAGETTLVRMTTAYGMFVNGGHYIQPIMIDRIQDRTGHTIFRRDQRECPDCNAVWTGQAPPELSDTRRQVLDPVTAYQIVSMAQGVVERGTAAPSVGPLGIPLGGKTGTTGDFKNAWFIGFSPDLVVGVWTGFDAPRSLGEGETGGTVAAPIFANFMRQALANVPPSPFRLGPGIRLVRIDYMTGRLPGPSSSQTILEAFREGTEPTTSN